jgi:hypothetical protein
MVLQRKMVQRVSFSVFSNGRNSLPSCFVFVCFTRGKHNFNPKAVYQLLGLVQVYLDYRAQMFFDWILLSCTLWVDQNVVDLDSLEVVSFGWCMDNCVATTGHCLFLECGDPFLCPSCSHHHHRFNLGDFIHSVLAHLLLNKAVLILTLSLFSNLHKRFYKSFVTLQFGAYLRGRVYWNPLESGSTIDFPMCSCGKV